MQNGQIIGSLLLYGVNRYALRKWSNVLRNLRHCAQAADGTVERGKLSNDYFDSSLGELAVLANLFFAFGTRGSDGN